MNIATFLFLHQTDNLTNINKDASINVCCEPHPTDNANKVMVTGVTVTVATRRDWSLQTSPLNQIDLENVLLTATSIRFVVDGQVYLIPIESRSKYPNSFSNPISDYYYFEILPIEFNRTPNNEDQGGVDQIEVAFLPYVQDEKYEYSDFNPLISNALVNRNSTYIQQSDRVGSGVNPTNLPKILSGSAEKAQIQDSNYSSTGWSNARYRGSTTDAQSYKGIPPAITAKTFVGEQNPSSSAYQLICSRSLTDRVTTEFLFTGDQETPSFDGLVSTKYELLQQNLAPVISLAYGTTSSLDISPVEIGSILQIQNKDTGVILSEKLRVTGIRPGIGGLPNTLIVTRGYLNTAPTTLPQYGKILTVKPLKIFKVDNTSAKIVNSKNSRIWVKDSKEILETDEYGLVYSSSSLCIT
jgi:hypothetical protein